MNLFDIGGEMSKYLVMAAALLVGMASAGVIIGNPETPSMDPFCAS